MIVGVPREIKSDEYRVAMLPVGVEELTQAGHRVLIEAGAGLGSGIADASMRRSAGRSWRCRRDLVRGRVGGEGQGAAADGVAPVAARSDGLHLLPLRGRRAADDRRSSRAGSRPSLTRRCATRAAAFRC